MGKSLCADSLREAGQYADLNRTARRGAGEL